METFTLVDALTARTTSGTGTAFTTAAGKAIVVYVKVTAISGTDPTLTVRLQERYDGTNWVDVNTTNLQTASITATGTARLEWGPGIAGGANIGLSSYPGRMIRAAWTIGGTTPSVTFANYFHQVG